jgi:colanic acid biosynthesis glycosyl transferase WcaI
VRIQLWSYNYDPEPTGIAPVSRILATGLRARDHDVEVVAAHPHYPEPRWGTRLTPYREARADIPVLRLPLWIGRGTASQRYRQELTFMAAQTAALPTLGRPDVVVSASPSFPAVLPAMINRRLRRRPWVLWLNDILPDGAAATGVVDEASPVVRVARRLERAAYRNADSIIVLSRAFTRNLVGKGVPEQKITLIYTPATREPATTAAPQLPVGPPAILSMGNIGFSQGLAPLVAAFEASDRLRDVDLSLTITGTGVAAAEVRREIKSDRIRMVGLIDDEALERELQSATIALVSQRYAGAEFNIPSKLMNFMAHGLPVLAAVNPGGEVARIIEESRGGWVVDSSRPRAFPDKVAALLATPADIEMRGRAARRYAAKHFSPEVFVSRFEQELKRVVLATRG